MIMGFYKNLGRKGRVFWNVLLLIIIFAAFGMAMLLRAVSAPQLTWEDFGTLNFNTHQCLGRCEAQFDLTNPTQSDITISDSSMFEIGFYVEKGPGLKSWELLKEEKITYYVDVPDYDNQTYDCSYYDNQTKQQVDKECWHWVKTGSHQEERSKLEYKSFDPIGKTLKPGETWRLKLIGHKKIALRENNVDWLLNFNGIDFPWAWWN